MRKKIGVLLSVFLAIIAFFAFVGCNYNGKKVFTGKHDFVPFSG